MLARYPAPKPLSMFTTLHPHIVVATGGTSDMPVAEEAALTAEVLGNQVTRLYDVGVAGLHRLLSNLEPLMSARCVVAVAGMEGALASVVGGLVDFPVPPWRSPGRRRAPASAGTGLPPGWRSRRPPGGAAVKCRAGCP